MNNARDHRTLSAATAVRHDLYGPAHAHFRHAHAVMFLRLARADHAQPQVALLADLRQHIAMSHQHLVEVERFVYPQLEARSPGATARLAEQHEQHRASYARLEELIQQVERAEGGHAVTAARDLYFAFTAFMVDDLRHMFEEEQQTWPLLRSLFTDRESLRIEQTIAANHGRAALLYPAPDPVMLEDGRARGTTAGGGARGRRARGRLTRC